MHGALRSVRAFADLPHPSDLARGGQAMSDKLNTITLADLLHQSQVPAGKTKELRHVL
jgi:hypothetical protein